jgi:putative DNA primase/helicase
VREVKKAAINKGGFDSETFKTAVGGESLEAEIKHGAHFTFIPRVAFVFGANGKIPLTNQGQAVHNRISVLHFRNQVAKEDQDIELIHKIKAELSGIVNKILAAGIRLKVSGQMIDPPTSQLLKKKWSSQVSSIDAWLNECCKIHRSIDRGDKLKKTTTTSNLFKAYKRFCEVQEIKPVKMKSFWDTLSEAHGINRISSNSGNRAAITLLKQPQK